MGSAVSAHSSGNTKLPQDKLLQWRADHAAREAESQLYVAMCRDLNAQWTEEDSAAVVPVEQPPGERVSTAVDEREGYTMYLGLQMTRRRTIEVWNRNHNI